MTEDNWGGVLFEEMETKCTWVEGVDSGERFEDAGIIPPQKGPHSHRHFLFSGGKHALFFSFCSFGCQFTVMIKTDNLKSFGAVSLLVHSRMLLSLKKRKHCYYYWCVIPFCCRVENLSSGSMKMHQGAFTVWESLLDL